jgi:hypothetical protein
LAGQDLLALNVQLIFKMQEINIFAGKLLYGPFQWIFLGGKKSRVTKGHTNIGI